MEIPETAVQNIQKFDQNRHAAEIESINQPLSATELHAYARRLDGTLQQLQDQVRRQEEDLKKLREVRTHGLSDGGDDRWARVQQARRAKKAYESLLQAEVRLPTTESVLPSLLAVEETGQLIKEGKFSVSVTAEKLSADRERLRIEEANLRDSRAIASGLRERIQRIRDANARKREQTPAQVAQEVVAEQKKKNKDKDRASNDLREALENFIDETLAPMLAAEDLGGPTVGDAPEVSDTTLNAGYTAHGKPKKSKLPEEPEQSNQQRIDQFLQRNTNHSNSTNKRQVAAKEMHELLNALLEADFSYIDLVRDSAASRFLIKAKVAQFHPRDARRLRLIDFGRSLGS
ncbi:hypothetical protein N7532_008626 [Penicillium argentinense]|uniref:Uncharacterized protein n=1 Tax=Penicillium argentinense TaxID=1131581 RepID=A0A9W9K2Q0_9EURO|nr:uncharacterized protein N7532_008626 [Penicillium argentinense]KAJ5089942.1 hypothetical protein N7532_008626 [Penicillium argentinense]